MGFCSSPILCKLVMDHLKKTCLNKLRSSISLNNNSNYFSNPPKDCKSPVLFYKRYVDECLLIFNKKDIKKILAALNNYHTDLKFTLEKEKPKNNSINFLDITIFRNKNSFVSTNWYKKETYSGRYLNFNSHHPVKQKIAIIYNTVDKCLLLSDKKFHNGNIKIAKKFLAANDYPLKFINKYAKKRIHSIKQNFNSDNNSLNTNKKNNNKTSTSKIRLVLPFFKYLNKKIVCALSNMNISIINKTTNKLKTIITLGKDKLEKFDKNNVVYKIKCCDCNYTYVSQTRRKLKKRVGEHEKPYDNKDMKSVFLNLFY